MSKLRSAENKQEINLIYRQRCRHSGFETQRCHQKSKTGGTGGPKKGEKKQQQQQNPENQLDLRWNDVKQFIYIWIRLYNPLPTHRDNEGK